MQVHLYSTAECSLCQKAQVLLEKLQKEFLFDLKYTTLTEDHPRFADWHIAVPVVVINDKRELKSVIDEAELRKVIREERPPTKLYYFGKLLEALGFLTVAVGLMAGMQGDMYTDLYFFIGGIAVFGAGRMIEKREMRRD